MYDKTVRIYTYKHLLPPNFYEMDATCSKIPIAFFMINPFHHAILSKLRQCCETGVREEQITHITATLHQSFRNRPLHWDNCYQFLQVPKYNKHVFGFLRFNRPAAIDPNHITTYLP